MIRQSFLYTEKPRKQENYEPDKNAIDLTVLEGATVDDAYDLLEQSELPEELKLHHQWETRLDEGSDPKTIINEIRRIETQRNPFKSICSIF